MASFCLFFIVIFHLDLLRAAMDDCYNEEGNASSCMPKFENVAFNRSVEASNTCGDPPEDYCMQTGHTRSCHICDSSSPLLTHDPRLITDFNRNEDPTWWQSQSMFYGVQYPNSVNLTLRLGKAFEITYIRLKFYTSRPESFAIYKRTEEAGPWVPYQFYSGSCDRTYGKVSRGFIRPGDDERSALCTDEFSDISPLSGGNVAFSTLEGRPSAYNFDQSLVLQDWVTATDLLVSLDRLNTFGDEFFKDAKVLRSYFYGISDFSVGGRCKCNGHASECVEGGNGALICACQHHTEGADCQRCHPFYQDRPWARGTGESANECLKCKCSGRSDQCVFDMEQYRSTGSGGHCVNCRDNTDGPHCERCKEEHYRKSEEEVCQPCDCNVNGSLSLQCDSSGMCACREGVMGQKCDSCGPGFHSLGPGGCRPCECDPDGSVGHCSPDDGRCFCKTNTEEHTCDRCKPGFFDLQLSNPGGCQPCFCFGHSSSCSSSSHYRVINISSDFTDDQDGWVGVFSEDQEQPLLWKEGEVYLLPFSEEDTGYYRAPGKFLGGQVFSYGQPLVVTFTSEAVELFPDQVSVILGGSGLTVRADLTPEPELDQSGLTPRISFTLRLRELETRFTPVLSSFQFQLLLNNLTSLKISNAGGANYTSQLARVSLTSASPGAVGPLGASWVEVCSCPVGFMGQFCEQCAPGFTREQPGGGSLSACQPCNCHHHGTCHPETGVCDCADFTTGPTCGQCLDGYYGNAVIGSSSDCQPCPCPAHSSCHMTTESGHMTTDSGHMTTESGQVICTNCPPGQTGIRCQMCEDGFYGDPLGFSGLVRPCERCECHGNVDFNALQTCDHVSGRCLKCTGHTEGDHCERCQTGYYGDALDQTAVVKCRPCRCSPDGTLGHVSECHPQTGQCLCVSHATGQDCSSCEMGFFNLQPGSGCERCKCDLIGSSSSACHPITGQCVCRAGVEGQLCQSCRPGFFGFSSRGCRACNCDPMGSVSMQCHSNGTCSCRQGFVGYKCDKCEINYFKNTATYQCEECPVCYELVKNQAEKLQAQIQNLEHVLSGVDCRSRSGRVLRNHRVYGAQRDTADTLPNALEEVLALQEAREDFLKQFNSLEVSSGKLSGQLYRITTALNCSERGAEMKGREEEVMMREEVEEEEKQEEEPEVIKRREEEVEQEEEPGVMKMREEEMRSLCQTFRTTALSLTEAQQKMQRAALDLDVMVIPFEIPSTPNKWNMMVNASEVLMKSHREAAEEVEAVARSALRASQQTLSLLQHLLMDSSIEDYIQNLTQQLLEMQQRKQDLAVQVNETETLQRHLQTEADHMNTALTNLTSSLHQLTPAVVSPSLQPGLSVVNQTQGNHSTRLDLESRVRDMDFLIKTKSRNMSEIRTKMESQIQAVNEELERGDEETRAINELKERGREAETLAVSSVVTAKEAESETMALHRALTHMVKDWPRQQLQTRTVLKKERPLRERVLHDVRRKVEEVEEMFKPALETSTQAVTVSNTAQRITQDTAKESKSVLSQAKHTRTASSHLSSQVDSALLRLEEQERESERVSSQISEPTVSLKDLKTDMASARLQLEAYSASLTELIGKIDGTVPLEHFDRILNDTARRLSMLRSSVESPALSVKIRKLQLAASNQKAQLSLINVDIEDMTNERDSLRDIVMTLPKTCPERD